MNESRSGWKTSGLKREVKCGTRKWNPDLLWQIKQICFSNISGTQKILEPDGVLRNKIWFIIRNLLSNLDPSITWLYIVRNLRSDIWRDLRSWGLLAKFFLSKPLRRVVAWRTTLLLLESSEKMSSFSTDGVEETVVVFCFLSLLDFCFSTVAL